MNKLTRMTTIVLWMQVTSAYFTYNDCTQQCKQGLLSCLITEANPSRFPVHCMDTEETCEQLASRRAVCLRVKEEPVGGEDIWLDYENHQHPTTTTEDPHPGPGPNPGPSPIPDKSCNYKVWRNILWAVVLNMHNNNMHFDTQSV